MGIGGSSIVLLAVTARLSIEPPLVKELDAILYSASAPKT